jgi:hypothetical protein
MGCPLTGSNFKGSPYGANYTRPLDVTRRLSLWDIIPNPITNAELLLHSTHFEFHLNHLMPAVANTIA